MIIENQINLSTMQEIIKILCKYALMKNQKKIKICSVILIIFGTLIILSNLIIFKLFYLIFGILTLIYVVIINLIFIKNKKRSYNLTMNEASKLFIDKPYIIRKYIFEKRNLIIGYDSSEKRPNLKFSFDNYYKIWIIEKKNVIVIQFNKKVQKQIVVINSDQINSFKTYCHQNELVYSSEYK